ncbi:uncharacterized protein [Amphiura filiformis]|uniref:uncharacterized protein n=1 Tax=Amphiura filiformis TaxID=82378 RepID=UPI003B20F09D
MESKVKHAALGIRNRTPYHTRAAINVHTNNVIILHAVLLVGRDVPDTVKSINRAILGNTVNNTGTEHDIIAVQDGQVTDAPLLYVHHLVEMAGPVTDLDNVHAPMAIQETGAKHPYAHHRVEMAGPALVLDDVHAPMAIQETDAKHPYVHHRVKMAGPALVLDDVHAPMAIQETDAKHVG